MENFSGKNTLGVHAGESLIERAVTQPIFQSSTYVYNGEPSYGEVRYIRLNNTPNHTLLGKKIAALEGAEAAVVTSSGMSAISTALLALTAPGDHVLAQDSLYGGTHHFFKDNFPGFHREVSFFPVAEEGDLTRYLKPNTKLIYVESISNPLLRIPNLPAVVAAAKSRGILTAIDNTFTSPIGFNPIKMGFDVVLHSATKYLNGHSDIVAGAVVGSAKIVHQVCDLLNHLGGSLDPHACFLLNRGIKTLGVRYREQCKTARELARALQSFQRVKKVIYPELEDHPDHSRAREWFQGAGGVLSFEHVGDAAQADQDLAKLRLPFSAPSLGGVESLITRPCTTSHSGVCPEDRKRVGISDSLIRVSVGLEDPADLIEDFRHAFHK